MKILSLNQDKGIGVGKAKGATVHLQAIRKAFSELGHDVIPLDDPNGSQLQQLATHSQYACTFDLVYERYALGNQAGSEFAKQFSIPHILEVNAPLSEEVEKWRQSASTKIYTDKEKSAFIAASHIVAVSADTKRYSLERGAVEHRVTVIPNGFDPSIFYPRDKAICKEQLGIAADSFVVGFHGRLRPWHRFEKLVAAVAQLHQQMVPIHLLTIGEGRYLELTNNKLPAGIHTHLPWVDVEQLGAIVAAYDVLPLMYSPTDPCYFSPLKLYEAMASGAVPVVPRAGTLPEVVRHNHSGLVYENGQLAQNIKELYLDPTKRSILSRLGVAQAQPHTWRRVAEITLQSAGLQG